MSQGANEKCYIFLTSNSKLAVSFHISHESKGRQHQHRSEAGIERCDKSRRNGWNMPECDSKAHHENDQYPSTSRKCLPYLHLGRQRGNPATVSVYDTTEHYEECGKDRSGNQQQRIGVSSSSASVLCEIVLQPDPIFLII